MSIQTPFVAASDGAGNAVERLCCNVELVFGGDFGLRSPGRCKASGGVARRLVRTKLAVVLSSNLATSLVGDSSHVFQLLSGEVEVVHAFDNTFGERIVVTKTRPAVSIARPWTIGEAVLGGALEHWPEDEVEGRFDGDNGCSKDWHLSCGGTRTPGEQCFVYLLPTLCLGFLEVFGLHSTALVLENAVPNAVVDSGSARANVDLVLAAFAEDKDIDAPLIVWYDARERQKPVDGWWSGRLDDVQKAVNEGDLELWEQCSQILKSREDQTKARIGPVRHRETQPGELEDEGVDVCGVVQHLDRIV